MSDTFDSIIGKVCVERGWVTRDQLVECLKDCSSKIEALEAESSKSRLTDMLISRGLVTPDQLSALRHEVSRILASDSAYTVVRKGDATLGQLLVNSGACSKEHLIEALSIQSYAANKGSDVPRLGEILLQKGYTSFAALEKALEVQKEKTLLHCVSCRSQYSVVDYSPKKKYLCKKCTGPLLLPGEIPPDIPEEVTNAQRNPKNILGKYVLAKELGRGGMGVVCKAWDTVLKRWVALKVLLGQGGKEELARFRREAQTAAALRHPNIVGIYEVVDIDDKHIIAMEYIDGRSLAGERLPALKAAEIIAQVSNAVEYAHSKGIIHRDIKPHNIMLDKEGKPFVMDFGLAKSMAAHSQITMQGAVVGTPSYMAPEQASGKAGVVGRHSDVYSLGAVLYEVLTGKPPFKGSNPLETLRMVVDQEVDPPSRHNSTILPDLDTIVVKCLEKDRNKRYPTAKLLAQDLERFSSGGQIAARPAAPAARLARKFRKQWAPVAAVGAAVLVLGLIIGIVAFSKSDKPEVRVLLKEGDRLAKAGDLRRALAQYDAARAIDSKNPEVLQRVAQVTSRIKQLEAEDKSKSLEARSKAQPEIDKGRTKMDRARTAFYQAGADLSRIDPLLQEAIEHFTAALSHAKDDADVYHLRGKAHFLRQNHDAAEKDFTSAIESLKTFSAAYYDRARVYLEYAAAAAGQKRLRDKAAEDEARAWRMKARVDLNTFREQGAQDAEQTDTAEALLASSESNYSKVVTICDRLIARQTSSEEVYKLRADALSNLGHNATVEATKNDFYRQAIDAYSEAINRKVNYPEAYLERGHIHFHAGNREAAMKDLDKATTMKLGGARWYSSRATILHEVGRTDEALADFERALALKPNDAQTLTNLGLLYYQRKDYRRAQEQYDRILAADPRNASALSNRSQARLGLGDVEGATADITEAARIDPKLRDLNYRTGRIYMARKEWLKAEEDFTRHLTSHPEDEPATYQRGIARYNQNKLREAISDWERCLKLNSRFKEDVERRLIEARRKLGE